MSAKGTLGLEADLVEARKIQPHLVLGEAVAVIRVEEIARHDAGERVMDRHGSAMGQPTHEQVLQTQKARGSPMN
jgi:hypothetical protein